MRSASSSPSIGNALLVRTRVARQSHHDADRGVVPPARASPGKARRARTRGAPPASRRRGAASSTCVSGSPKRALYSRTFGPASVSMTPMNSTPRNGRPSAASPRTVGTTTDSRRRRPQVVVEPRRGGVGPHAAGVGAAIGVVRAFVVLAGRELARTCSRRSGRKTTLRGRGAAPRRRCGVPPRRTRCPRASASPWPPRTRRRRAMTTPLPAARPSALTTSG